MDRLELGHILKKELDYVKSHFEPFSKSSASSTACTSSSSSHNFDIISQMISNIPTQNPCATFFTSRVSTTSVGERSVLETTSSRQSANESLRKRKLDDLNEIEQEESNRTRLRDIQNQSSRQSTKKLAIEANKSHVAFNVASQKNQTVELSQTQSKTTQPSVNNLDFSLDDLENNDCDI